MQPLLANGKSNIGKLARHSAVPSVVAPLWLVEEAERNAERPFPRSDIRDQRLDVREVGIAFCTVLSFTVLHCTVLCWCGLDTVL